MAIIGTLVVKLRADTAQFTAGMKSGAASLQKMQGQFAAIAAGAGAVAYAIGSIGKSSVQTAAKFEAGMARVAAVSGATGDTFKALEKSAMDLAAGTKFTATQAAEGMQFMAMAGFDAKTIIEGMPSVLNLAAAGAIELGNASDIVTNIMSGFGQTTEELAGSVDVVVAAITSANVDVRQLGESFKYAGPIAKSAGLSFEETAAAIAQMGNAGIQSSMAGTALRGAISRVLSPTDQITEALKKLGVKLTDSKGKLVSMTEMVRRLEPHAGNTAAMMQIFGLKAGPALAALVGQGSKSLELLVEKLKNAGGIAAKIASAEMATFSGQMMILDSQVERVQIGIGKILMPVLRELNNVLLKVLNVWSQLSSGTQTAIIAIGAAAGVVAALTAALALVGVLIPPLITAFTTLGPIVAGAFLPALVVIGKFVLIIAGIIAGIGAFRMAWEENLFGIRDTTADVVEMIKYAFEWWWDIAAKGIKWFVQLHLDAFSKIAEALNWITGGKVDLRDMIPNIDDLGKGFADAGKTLKTHLKDAVDTTIDAAGRMGDSFVTAFKKGLGTVGGALMGVFGADGEPIGDVSGGGGGKPPALVPAAAGGGGGGGIGGAELGDMMGSAFRQLAIDLGNAADQGFNEQIMAEGQAFAEKLGNIFSITGDMVNSALGSLGGLINDVVKGFQSGGIVGGVIAGVSKLFENSKALKKIVKISNKAFGILVKALEPVFMMLMPVLKALTGVVEALAPVLQILKVLEPIFKLLALALNVVGVIIHAVVSIIAAVWNTLLEIVASVVGIFSDDTARDIRKMKIDPNARYDEDENTEATNENTEATRNNTGSMNDMNETVKEVNEELSNVPDAFKIANARFSSIIGEDITAPEFGGSARAGGAFDGATIFIETSDPEDTLERMNDAAENESFGKSGTSVFGRSPKSTPGAK